MNIIYRFVSLAESGKRFSVLHGAAYSASSEFADLQLAERHGGDCEDVEASAEPPTSDDQSILPDGGNGTRAFWARRKLWSALNMSWTFCLRTKKAVLSKDGNGSQVQFPRSAEQRFCVSS
jgi:hypothetical protein